MLGNCAIARAVRTTTLVLLTLAVPACAARGAEDAGAVTVTAGPLSPGVHPAGINVRVRDEDERTTLRILAFADDALRRNGIHPDATAPLTLYLTFMRPRTVTSRSAPDVSILGRGGSSSRAEFGLSLELPLGSGPKPSKPARHTLIASLERGDGKVVWHAEAVTGAVPGRGEWAALRRMLGAVAKALAKARGAP